METPPQLRIFTAPPDERFSYTKLSGWDDLDRWATWNNPIWYEITVRAKMLNLTEVDRLRLLAGALLQYNVLKFQKVPEKPALG